MSRDAGLEVALNTMKKVCLLAVCIGLLLISCKQRRKADSPAESLAANESGERAGLDKRPIILSPKDPKKNQKEEQQVKKVIPLTRTEVFLPSSQRIVFADTVIGPLSDALSPDPARRAVYACISSFFSALSEGKVGEELLHPEWREIILRSLSFYVERGLLPEGVRIGEITIEQEAAEAPIRLMSRNRLAGRIFLEKSNGSWYITDVQGDFAAASADYVRESERFEPSLYRWIEEQ